VSGLLRVLTADQKQRRAYVSKEFRQCASDDATLLSKVIADNESWVYGYDLETKQQSCKWKRENSLRPRKARKVTSRGSSQGIRPGEPGSQFCMLL
jgi:hypothetical protein